MIELYQFIDGLFSPSALMIGAIITALLIVVYLILSLRDYLN